MSTITVESTTLLVGLVNAEMKESNFAIENPKMDVTLAQIRTAYKKVGVGAGESGGTPSETSHLFDKSGKPIVFINVASIVRTVKQVTPVE